jgi:subtilisin family serine protease
LVAVVGVVALWPAASDGAVADPGQWGLSMIGAQSAWPRTMGQGVSIAIIDSGINPNHPDLAGAIVGSADCTNAGGDPNRCQAGGLDTDGHGTSVAAIAAGRGIPGGTAGVAPAASLLAVKVLNTLCLPQVLGGILCRLLTNSSDVNAGVHWAVDHGAKVVNLSIEGMTLLGLPIESSVQYAWQHGVNVVAATGNNANLLMGPGYDGLPLVSVTALNRSGGQASYANNVGPVRWGVAAPGGETVGSCPETQVLSARVSGYGCWWGTSFAAPHVSGALALLRSLGLDAQQAVDALIGSARQMSAHPPDQVYGYGVLQAGRAVLTQAVSTTRAVPGGSPATTATPARSARSQTAHVGTASGPSAPPGRPVSALPLPPAAAVTGGGRPSIGRSLTETTHHGGLEPWAAVGAVCLTLAAVLVLLERRKGSGGYARPA